MTHTIHPGIEGNLLYFKISPRSSHPSRVFLRAENSLERQTLNIATRDKVSEYYR